MSVSLDSEHEICPTPSVSEIGQEFRCPECGALWRCISRDQWNRIDPIFPLSGN